MVKIIYALNIDPKIIDHNCIWRCEGMREFTQGEEVERGLESQPPHQEVNG